jgi:hypothetical protein
MSVGIEGRRQRGAVVHGFRGFIVLCQYQLTVADSAEQWFIFEVLSFNGSSS